MSIRIKLFAGFAMILTIFLVLNIVSYTRLENVEHIFTDFIKQDLALLNEARDVEVSFIVSESALQSYLSFGDQQHLDEYKSLDGQTDKHINELDKLAYKEQTKQLASQIKDRMGKYDEYVKQALLLKQSGKTVELHRYLMDNEYIVKDFNQAVNNLVQFQEKDSVAMQQMVQEKADKTNRFIIILSVITLLLGVTIALLIGRAIAVPLKNVAREAKRISGGDFSGADLAVNSRDELGVLAATFNQMRSNIKTMVQGLVDISAKMTAAIENLSHQARQTAAAANENASTTSEISALVDQVTKHTQHVAAVSDNTAQRAEAGAQEIERVNQQMQVIIRSSNQANQVLNELAETLGQVNQIVELITQIADQTNLLALNAAIEAARAGEQGRGFAVVAEEVRKLAEQSGNAAGEINKLINNVQQGSARAVAAMCEGNARVRDGAVVIDEVGDGFKSIIDAISGLFGQVQDLAAATQQISAGVQNVAATTEEQTAAVEEVSAATGELTKMAHELKTMAGRFNI
ncbi:methyl-accepting chemotaxis protein [Desulfotruncus alcoholivorax]|uniref:methyl-accepting chemotaxis protein n=1 Tax=Desulfotruncus alcoholivorax TaxID=265477 RepID=UPI00041FFC6E|nr:methyl-accepting chemotaxis protein [Desulfotruncus alcoholivorax]